MRCKMNFISCRNWILSCVEVNRFISNYLRWGILTFLCLKQKVFTAICNMHYSMYCVKHDGLSPLFWHVDKYSIQCSLSYTSLPPSYPILVASKQSKSKPTLASMLRLEADTFNVGGRLSISLLSLSVSFAMRKSPNSLRWGRIVSFKASTMEANPKLGDAE